MSKSSPVDVLKKAYQEGYSAFSVVTKSNRGFYQNPTNPYPSKGLPHKEWQRGFDMAYTDNAIKYLGA